MGRILEIKRDGVCADNDTRFISEPLRSGRANAGFVRQDLKSK
jgi:hypothetical protein